MLAQRSDSVSLNSDLGEGIGLHSFGNDPELMSVIDVANVACGFHAGDPDVMESTVKLAKESNVRVGAHPGLPDLVGFGRREMKLTPEEVESLVRYQVGALQGFLSKYSMDLNHIKPHGSLMGMVARSEELMLSVARVAKDYGVPVFGFAGTAHQRVAEREGVEFVGELYVDLEYDRDGNLVILRKPQEADPEAAADRVRRALETGLVRTQDGNDVEIPFSSVCVHSDSRNSIEVAKAVKQAITE